MCYNIINGDLSSVSGYRILLDIDGTLVADGECSIDPIIIENVKNLSINNYIYLFSNKKNHQRNKKIAEILSIYYIESELKKPNRSVIFLMGHKDKPALIIGDKFLTDGFLAVFSGSKFLKVARITGNKELFANKIIYKIDDLFYLFFKIFSTKAGSL